MRKFPQIKAKHIVQAGSLLLLFMGVMTPFAWRLHWRALLQVFPQDAGIGFVLAGSAFWCAARGALPLCRLLGVVLAGFGGGCFIAALWHFFPRLTEAVVTARVPAAGALLFLLLGVFFILMAQPLPSRASLNGATFLAGMISSIAVLGILVHAAGIAELGTWASKALTMPVPCVVGACLAAIAACVLLWMSCGASEMPLSATAATLVLVGLVSSFVGVSSFIAANADAAVKAREEIESAYRQINFIHGIVGGIRRAETAERGFLLTAGDQYLKAHARGVQQVADGWRNLSACPYGDGRADPLRRYTKQKLEELAAAIDLRREQRSPEALAMIESGNGLILMDQIDAESDRLVGSLRADLAHQLDLNERSLHLMQRTVFLSRLIALMMIGLALALIRLEMLRRAAVESTLRETGKGLEQKVAERTCEIAQQADELREAMARRILVERALLESDARFSLALRHAKVAVWTWEPAEDKAVWSGPVEELLGFGTGQWNSYAHVREAIFCGDRARVDEQIAKSLRQGCDLKAEFRIVRAAGDVRWMAACGGVLFDENGQPTSVSGILFDISERRLAEIRLEASERELRQLADAMPQIVWRSTPNGEMDYCNQRWHEYTGCTVEQAKASFWRLVVHPEDFQRFSEINARGFAGNIPFQREVRLQRAADSTYRWHVARSVPYMDESGKVLRWFGASTDIHEQKLAKERLEAEVVNRTVALRQLEVKEEDLRRSLAEKNVLLQEVHHRVKNNLQVISSLLRMKAESLQDEAASAALKESQQRVHSMALIHERLYGSLQADYVDFEEYIQTLVSDLFFSYSGSTRRLTSRLRTSPVFLKIEQAIPCGLILNELVTNALKYAYPNDENGEIVVALHESALGYITVCVSDEGVGLPEGFDWHASHSMGLPIVDLLANQLGGEIRVHSHPGATFSVEFPREAKEPGLARAAVSA